VGEELLEAAGQGRVGGEVAEHRLDHLPVGLGGQAGQQQQLRGLRGGQQPQGLQLGKHQRNTGVGLGVDGRVPHLSTFPALYIHRMELSDSDMM